MAVMLLVMAMDLFRNRVRPLKVSIIIATRNRCGALGSTLRAVKRLGIPDGMQLELIVVDNGAKSAASYVVREAGLPFARYISVEKGGKANALNAALCIASGEVLIFTDDDVCPLEGWLHGMTQPLVEDRCDMLCGSVRIAPHLLRPWMTEMHKGWLASTDYLNPRDPESAVGANMAIARRVLEVVPAFDPELGPGRLGLWEDTLFSLQVREAGFRLGFAEDAIVEHRFDPSRLTRRAFLMRAKAEARSSAYVAWHWKHENHSGLLVRSIGYRIRLALKKLLLRRSESVEGVAQWEMDLVTGIEFARCYRHESKRRRAYHKRGCAKIVDGSHSH